MHKNEDKLHTLVLNAATEGESGTAGSPGDILTSIVGRVFVLNTLVIVRGIVQASSRCLVCRSGLWLCPDYPCWLNHLQCGCLVGVLLLISTSHCELAGGASPLASTATFQVLLMLLMSLSQPFRLLRVWFIVCVTKQSAFHALDCPLRIIYSLRGGCMYLFI